MSVAAFEDPKSNAVIELVVEMPVIELLLTVEPAPLKFTDMGITVPAAVVMFDMVFPLMVLTGAPPSVLTMPLNADAPVKVKFEKLLLLTD